MSKFKVWLFLYILIWAVNLNVSYANADENINLEKTEKIIELKK